MFKLISFVVVVSAIGSSAAWAQASRGVRVVLGVNTTVAEPREAEGQAKNFENLREEDILAAVLVSDLNFGKAQPGMPEKTINPGEMGSAMIQIIGTPGSKIHVNLPLGVELESDCGCGYIIAEKFTMGGLSANPKSNLVTLDSSGTALLSVGATRETLPPNLKPANYRGLTTVELVEAADRDSN